MKVEGFVARQANVVGANGAIGCATLRARVVDAVLRMIIVSIGVVA